MTAEQDPPTASNETETPRERCAGCDAPLVADQRYCLRCGIRRGRPRLDFTAFWAPPRSTALLQGERGAHSAGADGRPGEREPGGRGAGERGAGERGAGERGAGGLLSGGNAPSRRLAGVLAAFMLAAGIVAGATLGPTPPSSPADSSTLAQRALAALVARAGGGSPTNAPAIPASSTAAPTEAATPSAPVHKAKAAAQAASTPVSLESSSPSEPSSATPASEGSSSEAPSSKGSGEGEKATPGTPIKLPPIKHVWLISLSDVSLVAALKDPKADPYLAKWLAPKGILLSGYTLSAPSALGNGIALLSGQGVNLDTEQNCPSYVELQPPSVSAANGLAEGVGCVYPAAVKTLADELTAGGLTWKAYVQGMEETTPSAAAQPAAGAVTCRHPELGATDPNNTAVAGDPYLTFRNPFVYFDSLLAGGACASDDVNFSQLLGDLASSADTPSFSWIVPSACDDGSSTPCAPGAPAGLGPADAFLKEMVGQILATAAYREGGLIAIVPDSPPGVGSSSPAGSATTPVGALLLSPFVHSGTRVPESFNDFSLLKSLARLFGVLPLGHANDPGTVSFGATVYSTTEKAAQAASRPRRQTTPHAGG